MSKLEETTTQQYSRKKVIGLWALATLPMILLTWVITPWLIPIVPVPAVLIYWFLLPINAAWQIGLSLWVLRRETGSLQREMLSRKLWLNGPLDPKSGQPCSRLYAWLIPLSLVALVAIGLGLFYQLLYFPLHWMIWPSFAYISEAGSPEFAGQWGWLLIVFAVWVLNMFLAEELFFRGLLLPRMNGRFGRLDWLANALLYGLYYLWSPFVIPFRILLAMVTAGPARRYQSLRMALIIRGLEGVTVMLLAFIGVTSRAFPPLTTMPARPYLEPGDNPNSQWSRGMLTELPALSDASGELDLRASDLSALNLSGSGEILVNSATFNTKTVWPPAERMPSEFDQEQILELGRDPGLGVRGLHANGITGRGVGIAIIDQPLLTSHEEFAGQLRWYEKIHPGIDEVSMHGSAVSSLAVGRTIGVAPQADLYYFSIGADFFTTALWQFHYHAKAIRRVLQINQALPAEQRIRVISISLGWSQNTGLGCYDIAAAVKEAQSAGVLVVYTSMENTYGVGYMGLGREPLGDPNLFESYTPGSWWQNSFYSGHVSGQDILAPMDYRTTADFTGTSDYVFYRVGGLSWTTPYLAGVYALAVQVDPSITPEGFLELALETGRTIEVTYNGQTYSLGPIIDPPTLIAALQARQ